MPGRQGRRSGAGNRRRRAHAHEGRLRHGRLVLLHQEPRRAEARRETREEEIDSGVRPVITSYSIHYTKLYDWRDIWSAGQGVGQIDAVLPVVELVTQLGREYAAARERLGL